MNKREIVIFHNQTGTKEVVESSATTWGELKKELSGNVDNKTLVLSKSKLQITLDTCELPAEKFTVFVYPKESKGGAKKKAKKTSRKPAKKVKKAKKKPAAKAKKPVRKAKGLPAFIEDDAALKKAANQIANELGD